MIPYSITLRAILITGISGSGKSVVLRMLEDNGFVCTDNLPVHFLTKFIFNAQSDGLKKVAIAIDSRSPGELAQLPKEVAALREMGIKFWGIFLDAKTQVLERRYSKSRRQHPLSNKLYQNGKIPSLLECIALERELLAPLRDQEHVIDTSDLTPSQLRTWMKSLIQEQENYSLSLLTFESFGYKFGVPNDADLVFDVRCLPNPFYVSHLQSLTGKDALVINWLRKFEIVNYMIRDINAYLQRWLPHYIVDTRSYITVAIGCTGGQHRSVYVVEELAKCFSCYKPLLVRHRRQFVEI